MGDRVIPVCHEDPGAFHQRLLLREASGKVPHWVMGDGEEATGPGGGRHPSSAPH